ncbi:MAG TPA: hypothetical protein VGD63_11935 [Steroidobacteraceae bacterium]
MAPDTERSVASRTDLDPIRVDHEQRLDRVSARRDRAVAQLLDNPQGYVPVMLIGADVIEPGLDKYCRTRSGENRDAGNDDQGWLDHGLTIIVPTMRGWIEQVK